MQRVAIPRMLIRTAVLVTIVTLGAGCPPPRGFVAKEWSMAMRELNIVPVFPPREDVQVGDLYVSPLAPDDEDRVIKEHNFVPLGLWVGTVDVSDSLAKFYDGRLSFPKTTTAPTTNPNDIYPQPTTQANVFLPGHDVGRLRMVGFPVFMSATFRQGDLSAVIPAEAVSLAIAAGFTASRTVNVSVPVAESYGLPAHVVFTKLVIPDKGQFVPTSVSGNLTTNDLPQYLPKVDAPTTRPTVDPDETNREVVGYLRLITEVFYARTLDVSIGSTSSGGAKITGRPVTTLPTTLPTATTQPATPDPINYDTATPQQIAADLNRQLDSSAAQTFPGGSFKFLSVSQTGISMRRTYERPVAIGYRAVTLEVVRVTRLTKDSKGKALITTSIVVNGIGPSSAIVPTSLLGQQKFIPTTK